MQLAIDLPIVLLAAAVVIFLPGAGILAVTRLDRVVPPPLVPAAALSLGLLPLGAATATALALRAPIWTVAAALGAVVLACWGELARRSRAELRGSRARAWLVPARSVVAGEWLRGTPAGTWAMGAVAAVLAFLVGFYAWNDSLYHIGQAQKLLALERPGFSNTLQFPDGSAHPGYLLPLWQTVLALTSLLARVDPVMAAWLLPVVTVPTGVLAVAGLGWALARSRAAATPVAAAWTGTWLLGTLPSSEPIFNGLHPGSIALQVLAPLALALLFTALWPMLRRSPDDPTPRAVTHGATFLAAVAVAGIGVLHVGYLLVVAIGILGYLLLWALGAPWPGAVVRRHAAVLATIFVVAATCVALLLPGLTGLASFGRDAAAELEANESELYEGENAAELDELLVGGTEQFHLRPDYLVLAGGLALAGLLVMPLAMLTRRWPGAWYLAGSAIIVLGIALSDVLFPRFVEVVTLDQARRIERALPHAAALGLAALAAAGVVLQLWRHSTGGRLAGAALATAAAGALFWSAQSVDPLAGYAGARTVRPELVVLPLPLLLLGAGAWLLLLVRRVAQRSRPASDDAAAAATPQVHWLGERVGPRAGLLATAIVLVGWIPLLDGIERTTDPQRLSGLPADQRAAELRFFSPKVADELRALPPGSIVLADPRSRNAYYAMAVAPVYVVASVARHTANTPENRVEQRFRTATTFFDRGDRAQRLRVLLDERVDAVIVHPRGNVVELLEETPGVRMVARDVNQRMYRVDRRRLRTALAR